MSSGSTSAERTAPRGSSSAFVQLITFIANQPGMADIIIRNHSDDGTGHCRLCSAGGQTGHYTWPCPTYHAAQAANLAGEAACREAGPVGGMV
jgi:hypothetical protein